MSSSEVRADWGEDASSVGSETLSGDSARDTGDCFLATADVLTEDADGVGRCVLPRNRAARCSIWARVSRTG